MKDGQENVCHLFSSRSYVEASYTRLLETFNLQWVFSRHVEDLVIQGLSHQDLIYSQISCQVDDGESTPFWNDISIGTSSLKTMFPHLHALSLPKEAAL